MKLGSKFVVDATETYGRKAIDNHRSIHRTFNTIISTSLLANLMFLLLLE